MAALKYLSEFYTTKAAASVAYGPLALDPSSPLESQIQTHVLRGNQLYFAGKYASALNEYLAAWGLIPRLLDPFFPIDFVAVAPELLLKVDLTKELMTASVEIHRLRDSSGPLAPLGALDDPPPGLQSIAKRFGSLTSPAERRYGRGLVLAGAGQFTEAGVAFRGALELARDDRQLQLDARAAIAAVTAGSGDYAGAQQQFLALARETDRRPGAQASALLHNSAVAQTLNGDAAGAAAVFATASLATPGALNWSVTHSVNPGIAGFQRPAGPGGLEMVLPNRQGAWQQLKVTPGAAPKPKLTILQGDGGFTLDLTTDPVSAIRAKLLEPRVAATTIAALELYQLSLPQFVTYLSHVAGFLLPLALGDTYSQLGDYTAAASYYIKARDYPFLNLAIERPMLWARLARTYVRLGNRLYRDRDMAGARTQYENVVRIAGGGFTLTGPLYSGGFAPVAAEILAFLNAPDKLVFVALDFERRAVVIEALSQLQQILANINYLGFPEDIVPIHSWRYLQNVARYLANQASQMERGYISFQSTAEQEEATRLSLEQSVDAAKAAAEVEAARVKAANDQLAVAQLGAEAAGTRLENAVERKADYAATSQKLAVLDEISAWATGPMDKAEVDASWGAALGLDPGTYDTYQVTRYASRARSKISRAYELRNMDRQIEEAQDSLAIAGAQVTAGQSMVAVAEAQQDLADLRRQQAEAQLANFNAEEFTPELWHNLALAQRELSQRYLDHAIGAAFLMERAFEFEYDLEVNRIRFDYTRSNLNGLLSGDFLLADIDEFTFDRLLDTQKKVPLKVVIPLADRYPFQFFQQFQKSGRMEFDLLLEDFDRLHPGAHLQKLRRVEVFVEGSIPREGAQGILRNSGFSFFRGRDGTRRIRQQKPEAMLLSLFDARRDGFLLTTEEGVLQLFENSGPATSWILELPTESNNFDLTTISNVNLVLYFDAYYAESVAHLARAELEAGAVYQQTLGLALRFQFPDEFFALQDTGSLVFEIGDNYMPPNQVDPRILDAQIVVVTEDGTPAGGLALNVTSAGGLDVDQTTDADGVIATGTGAEPLNAARGQPLLDTWTIAFPGGFDWGKVTNVFLNLEYGYEPRDRPAATDDFATDTLADYDRIDDAAAGGGPSVWAHIANLGGAIRQTSGIVGGPVDAGPVKPGTYLVHKTSAQWPDLADVSIRCHLGSGDDHALGLVFRYQDVDNFYFFLMDRARNYRRIGKKVAGVFQELDTPVVQTVTPGFELNRTYEVAVAAVGDAIAVSLDGVVILTGRDTSIAAAGRVGLYAWGNPGASFLDLSVRRA